ncbi:hypothetical protein METBIDRAFT_9412 [Metschnikowia bicuspidata var. bicuspidata NRRL YB-4993]|uniref:PA14 domain-containing protein n=1 Tax=Metschnikowia bicuspidata var. bicuspidata NRRL YB-4993 TaxID=869754 RepID=A0A1A0HGI0_9ASCO|nr:hypothetical protein METBIDRAFT_9412 [Metschnikowia bicuspidata var. bicuspidata NRRL YB-4993]OBA23100.1 hypothetical protein METBIDRAFT_9412 [Metschnikowia bicuspidata var. bicuspidata NRRL YB-4993]
MPEGDEYSLLTYTMLDTPSCIYAAGMGCIFFGYGGQSRSSAANPDLTCTQIHTNGRIQLTKAERQQSFDQIPEALFSISRNLIKRISQICSDLLRVSEYRLIYNLNCGFLNVLASDGILLECVNLVNVLASVSIPDANSPRSPKQDLAFQKAYAYCMALTESFCTLSIPARNSFYEQLGKFISTESHYKFKHCRYLQEKFLNQYARMLHLFLYFAASLVGVVSATSGCTPTEVGAEGFDARFYTYGLRDNKGWDEDFFSSTYKTTLLKTVTGVTSINFQYSDQPDRVLLRNTIYGYDTTISNYTLELSGFYKAAESGTYSFKLAADNGASLQFGSGQSCCNDASGSVSGDFNINTLGPYGGGGNTAVNVNTASFTLTKGIYYPVKIVMFNWLGNTGIDLQVTDPSGDTITDFGSQVFQATFANSKCYTTVTSVWSKTFTSTTTETGKLTDTVVVEVPKKTTTITSTWTNSFESTTTAIGKLTDTVIVEVPHVTTTVTSIWNKNYATTTTATGKLTDTVIVEIPHETVTVTSTWTENYATTSTVTGSLTDTVVVDVPKTTVGKTRTTSTATGSLTDTVVVGVPHETVTVTSTWTKNYATTTTVTGSLTDTVVVDVPKTTVAVESSSVAPSSVVIESSSTVPAVESSSVATSSVVIESSSTVPAVKSSSAMHSSSSIMPYSSGGWNMSYTVHTLSSLLETDVRSSIDYTTTLTGASSVNSAAPSTSVVVAESSAAPSTSVVVAESSAAPSTSVVVAESSAAPSTSAVETESSAAPSTSVVETESGKNKVPVFTQTIYETKPGETEVAVSTYTVYGTESGETEVAVSTATVYETKSFETSSLSAEIESSTESVYCYRGVCVTSNAEEAQALTSTVPVLSAASTTSIAVVSSSTSTTAVPQPSQITILEGGASKKTALLFMIAFPVFALLF